MARKNFKSKTDAANDISEGGCIGGFLPPNGDETQLSPNTVPMVRDEPMHTGGPTTATVALSEVENWQAHGWTLS